MLEPESEYVTVVAVPTLIPVVTEPTAVPPVVELVVLTYHWTLTVAAPDPPPVVQVVMLNDAEIPEEGIEFRQKYWVPETLLGVEITYLVCACRESPAKRSISTNPERNEKDHGGQPFSLLMFCRFGKGSTGLIYCYQNKRQ